MMERTIGVDKARTRLGQIADEIVADDEAVVLTRRGQAVAVLISPAEYDALLELRRKIAREELQARLAEVREKGASAGLDVSVVDEAIEAARTIGKYSTGHWPPRPRGSRSPRLHTSLHNMHYQA
jgi:prevent-host-death family protein